MIGTVWGVIFGQFFFYYLHQKTIYLTKCMIYPNILLLIIDTEFKKTLVKDVLIENLPAAGG